MLLQQNKDQEGQTECTPQASLQRLSELGSCAGDSLLEMAIRTQCHDPTTF